MTAKAKTVADSRTVSSELILYSDLNSYGTVFGGRLVSIIDKVAAISARKHTTGGSVVTAAIDHLAFERPAPNGSIITVRASVNRVFTTSMEVGASVTCIEPGSDQEIHVCSAYFTFVLLDRRGRPQPIPPVAPATDAERRRFAAAQLRRESRLRLRDQLAAHDTGDSGEPADS